MSELLQAAGTCSTRADQTGEYSHALDADEDLVENRQTTRSKTAGRIWQNETLFSMTQNRLCSLLTPVDLSVGERAAFAEAAHVLCFEGASETTQKAINPVALLAPRRVDDQGSDLWKVFNVIQENALKGGLTGTGCDANNRIRQVTTRPINSIDDDVKLNRALWVLAERLASLKNAA